MPVRWTVTSQIGVPNVRFFDQVGKLIDDPDAAHPEIAGAPVGELLLTWEIRQQGNLLVAILQTRIVNGQAEGLRAKVAPIGPADWIEVFSSTAPLVATAYNSCKTAYQSGGRQSLCIQLLNLGLLPPGAASGSLFLLAPDDAAALAELEPLP